MGTWYLAIALVLPVAAGNGTSSAPPRDPAYERVIAERAGAIVAKLNLADNAQAKRVAGIVADQYRSLSGIHDRRDQLASDATTARQALENEIFALHRSFIARLAAELSADEVDKIRDGMTYGVVSGAYARYVALLPELTDDDRRQIRAWLIEAREYAMDAGSSEEKHGWFRKYKGRIGNYLSQRGFDLDAAEKRLQDSAS